MPNLHDVVELVKPTAAKKRELAEIPVKLKAILEQASSARAFLKDSKTLQLSTAQFQTEVAARIQDLRSKAFRESLALPDDLVPAVEAYHIKIGNNDAVTISSFDDRSHRTDNLGHLSKQFQSTVSKMRTMADTLGMVIMPYEYLNPASLRSAGYSMQNAVKNFASAAEEQKMRLFVVAPLSLYSTEAHMLSGIDDTVYSKQHEQMFMTLDFQMPLFRSMSASIKALGNRVDSLEAAHSKVQEQMQAINKRLSRVEEEMAEARKQEALQRIELARVQEQAQLSSWIAHDPLIFAVQENTNVVTGDGPAIIGPCWGPDFPEVLLDVCGLSMVKNQRKAIGTANYRFM